MTPVPLSHETRRRIDALFAPVGRAAAERLLVAECGNNLPFCEHSTAESLERLRFAALKLSEGSLQKLREAVELAKLDWRDLLMAAGFGHDVAAHAAWFPEVRKT